ncbi:hypothetical protein HPC49_10715 [Pyxidicoccus fallax]|uniref:HYR domain-containing protein n=1 Tax=Pyxidicoccus fallax TaxID=394095 RepID=A0A848LCD7_9BACT|nr:hypothetical protein [Pyxidicoccus fallax]NMO16146.1 hypothetical protein [Pyxidicoccus fallax]NPC78713.1 hypothetical protein [Pyxidicoccus fallax]
MFRGHRNPTLVALLVLGGAAAGVDNVALAQHRTGLDLATENVSATCEGTTLRLTATTQNLGATGISASRTGIYAGDPAEGGVLLGSVEVPWLYGREPYPFERTFTVPEGTRDIFVIADDDRFFPEDDELNNVGSFTFAVPCSTNQEPVAVCEDVTVVADAACQAPASIDAGSRDPDGQPGPFTAVQSPQGPFTVGSTPVHLTVSDGASSSTCSATVTVVDATAPTPGASRGRVLAPSAISGHVVIPLSECALPATDNCGGTLDLGEAGTILRVTSDEPNDALSLLRVVTCEDIELSADRKSARVRAEAALLGNGRVYTFTYSVSDASGNASIGTCRVSVPALLGNPAVDSGPAYCRGTDCPASTGPGLLCAL